MTVLDFEALFRVAPNPYMVLDKDLRYVAVNDAYLRATKLREADLLGRNVFEIFPNDPTDPANLPLQMLRTSFARVLETRAADHIALMPYRMAEGAADQSRELRYWSCTHTPLLDARGEVAFILQHTVDVSALRAEVTEAGPLSDRNIERADVLSRANAVQEQNVALAAERERFARLFESAPGFMAFLEGPEHVFTVANAAYRKVTGHRPILGKSVRDALPEVVEQGYPELLDRVYQTGTPFIGTGVHIALMQTPGAPLEEAILDFIYEPILGPDGRPHGIFVQGHDVTARRKAEAEREEALIAATAFSEELASQSREVKEALDRATARIAELEARLAKS